MGGEIIVINEKAMWNGRVTLQNSRRAGAVCSFCAGGVVAQLG